MPELRNLHEKCRRFASPVTWKTDTKFWNEFVYAVNVIVRKFVSKIRVVFRVWSKGLLPRVQGSIESLANPARDAASSCKF